MLHLTEISQLAESLNESYDQLKDPFAPEMIKFTDIVNIINQFAMGYRIEVSINKKGCCFFKVKEVPLDSQ